MFNNSSQGVGDDWSLQLNGNPILYKEDATPLTFDYHQLGSQGAGNVY
jgi:hypothetical protein